MAMALQGMTTERNATVSSTKDRPSTKRNTIGV